VRLNAKNFDAYAPAGKEADAIYGDYVLRNDKIVCVIADPVPTRHANMTIRNVGGCVIDLTSRKQQNDQLGCYYPGAGRYQFRFHEAIALRAHGIQAGTVKPPTDGVEEGLGVRLEVRAPAEKGELEVRVRYKLMAGLEHVTGESYYVGTSDGPLSVERVD